MGDVHIDTWLYGPLARYGGEADQGSFAHLELTLPSGSRVRDLLTRLDLPSEERGITFINGQLSAMPGLQPDLDHELQDGDRVALFHLKSMWPFQYRDGSAVLPALQREMETLGQPFHQRSRQDGE
jgi:sulfur carrier protein ThiS